MTIDTSRHARFFPAFPGSLQDWRRAFMLMSFIVALAGLTIQSCILANSAPALGLDAVAVVLKLLSYFTILTNLLVLGSHGVVLLFPGSRLGRALDRPSVRSGLLLYIVLVSALYTLLLARTWNPQGWQAIADFILHYATPLLYLVFWLLFVPKVALPWRLAITWLAYPAVYLAWVLGRGAILGDYPYFFIDPEPLGYGRMLLYSAAIAVVFLSCGLGVIACSRHLHQRGSKPLPGQEGLK